VITLARTKRQDGTVEQSGDMLDDVSVRHDKPYEWRARGRWRRCAEGALAFKQPDEPMKLEFVYAHYLWLSRVLCQ